jgi:flagellar basal body-associated protein FliL
MEINTYQIILAIIIVGLSIIMPIYYSSKKKKEAQNKELQKIKMYGERINQFTRNKDK